MSIFPFFSSFVRIWKFMPSDFQSIPFLADVIPIGWFYGSFSQVGDTRSRGTNKLPATREYSATQGLLAESCEILMHNFPPFYSDARLHARTCTLGRGRGSHSRAYVQCTHRRGLKTRVDPRVHSRARSPRASFNANFPVQNPVNRDHVVCKPGSVVPMRTSRHV